MAPNKKAADEVIIRNLQPEDHPAISALAKRSFSISQSRFVIPSKIGGKVITINDKLVAASLLRMTILPSGNKIGFIAWLMTHPEYRCRGLANKLVKSSTALLQLRHCDNIVTDVEGYNTSSANVFYRSGYRRISVWQYFSRWNLLDSTWLSIKTGLAFDPGHFLWVADAVPPQINPWREQTYTVLFNTLFAVFAFSLGNGIFSDSRMIPSVQTVVAIFIAVGILLSVREIGMKIVAWLYKCSVEFRSWSGGWAISLLVALAFGNIFPLPGNIYPRGDGWSVRHYQGMLGQGAIVSNLFILCLIIMGSLLKNTASNEFLGHFALALLFVGKPLLVFDTLVAVAPFEGFNGRHLRDYNHLIWLVLSTIAVIVFIWA